MSFARFSPLRTAARRVSALPKQTGQVKQWQRIARRGYADAHKAQKTSDLPWLIGSVAITVPGTYFILNSGGHKGDDHHLHQGSVEGEGKGEELDDSHEESTEESTEESLDEEPAKDQEESDDQKEDAAAVKQDDSEDNKDDKEDDKTEDVKSGDNKIEGKPAKSDNEGKTVTEQPSDNKISEKTKDGDDSFDKEHEIETDSENKTIHKPDAKGGAKRRVESANAIELNKESQGEDEDDKASASKDKPKPGSMSEKQAGLTNTDTKHSTDPVEDGKSKKSEGAPETAKLQGTVKPDRPLQ